MTTTNGTSSASPPRITLYTNHGCPYAHRAHITLKELGLDYDEVIIDLSKPREEWYLKINPRGLVPTMKYNDETILESAIVSQYLADAHPSHLAPPSNEPRGASTRARQAFFADTWTNKVQPAVYALIRASANDADGEEGEKKASELAEILQREIEPLLHDAAPFFGGSSELTMAEVMTVSFIIRLYAHSRGGLVAGSLVEKLDALPRFAKWAHAAMQRESVTYVWNEKESVEGMKARLKKMSL